MGSFHRGAVYHRGVRRISDEVDVRCSYENVAEIVDAHADALLLFARQWSKVSAEDVVQEAFLRLVRRVKEKNPPDNVVAWLYSVVRNELTTMHHKGRHSRAREEDLAAERPTWFEPSVETRLDASRAAEQLKILPIEQRETVVARIWGQLSFEEIASLTKSSRSTVHRRYVSGLDALRKSLS